MRNTALDFFNLGTALVSSMGKRQLVSKEVLIDLANGCRKTSGQKLIKLFCRNAKEPKLALKYSANESANNVTFRFLDGTTPLSRGNFTQARDGQLNFDFSLVNARQVEHLNASGHYNPNVRLFEWSNFGETLEHRAGYTAAKLDSTGFSISARVKDESALKVLRNIQSSLKYLT